MTDPWLDLDGIVRHSATGVTTIKTDIQRPDSDPQHLKAVKHAGRIKARVSWVDDWVERASIRTNDPRT